MSAAIRAEFVEEIRAHVAWLKAEVAAGRVTNHEAELAWYEQQLRDAEAQRPITRLDALNAALAYALLIALGWTLLTADPIPTAIAGLAALALSHVQERKLK